MKDNTRMEVKTRMHRVVKALVILAWLFGAFPIYCHALFAPAIPHGGPSIVLCVLSFLAD
jgi:hypothetical protein